jgi:hypothetical protein
MGIGNIETELGISAVEIELAVAIQEPPVWRGVGMVAAWEAQSQLATMVMVALVAMVSAWWAFGIMLAWSLIATVVYDHARKRGLPDLLERGDEQEEPSRRGFAASLVAAATSAVKVWLVGVQAFVYSRTLGRVFNTPARCWRTRLARSTVLGLGLTLYGVTTCHHLLRRAGYSDGGVLRLSLVGSLLNVSYRVLLGAIIIDAFGHLISLA